MLTLCKITTAYFRDVCENNAGGHKFRQNSRAIANHYHTDSYAKSVESVQRKYRLKSQIGAFRVLKMLFSDRKDAI